MDFQEKRERLLYSRDAPSSLLEGSKWKPQNDFRTKRIHEGERFQDKIHNRANRPLFQENRPSRRLQKPEESPRHLSNAKPEPQSSSASANEAVNEQKLLTKEPEVYDPLSQDMDNDGVADRYDHDFRDSDSFESTYDVEEPKNEIFREKPQPKPFKQTNFRNSYSPQKTETVKKTEEKAKEALSGSDELLSDRKISRIRQKQNQLQKAAGFSKLSKTQKAKSAVFLSGARGLGLARNYLQSGSAENVGVEGAEKVSGAAASKLVHSQKNYSAKRLDKKEQALSKLEGKIQKRKSKLEFKDRLSLLEKQPEYQQARQYKQFLKRRQMKASISRKQGTRIRDRLRKAFTQTARSAKNLVSRKAKGALFSLLGTLGLIVLFMTLVSTVITGFSNGANAVAASTYLSPEKVMGDVNQSFSTLEYELSTELENVETNYPGYDEYEIHKEGDIGHDLHELLSYITARYGEVKDASEVQDLIQDLFHRIYDLKYEETSEIRTRWVQVTKYDSQGRPYVDLVREEYPYRKLVVTLSKKDMDSVIREIFKDFPDNLRHYETLLETKGNMGNYFGSGSDLSEIVQNPDLGNPGIAFSDAKVRQLFHEAEKHIGKRYVFGANGPDNFDCSSFVCWVYTQSGIAYMPRTTAWGIYTDYCRPISPSEAKAGDIIFFKGTYDSGQPISHVGIYAGEGMMIHAGDPIQFTSINAAYWQEHFYGFGRPK